MKYRNFRNFKIIKNCNRKYRTYTLYKNFLQKDFRNRCAYCNMLDEIIAPKPYEVDHFIPRDAFKDVKPELEYDYLNLMYSCPKCNGNKSDFYKGNINEEKIYNEYFYNPVETDYNEIFYRNEYGGISSVDKKGNEMILMLKLYNPIHNLAWLIDKIDEIEEKVSKEMESIKNDNSVKYKKLMDVDYRLLRYKDKLIKIFKANYYNNEWK